MRGLIELDYMLKQEAAEKENTHELDLQNIKDTISNVYSILDRISLQLAEKEEENTIEEIDNIKEEINNEN